MPEFIKMNWIALLSLLIALFGGAPGVIAIIKYFRQKTNFKYTSTCVVIGTQNQQCMLLLGGTFSNSGDRPLIPYTFDLKVKIGKTWYPMLKTTIPKNLKLESNEQTIDISEPWTKDLSTKNISITQSNSIDGFLLFSTNSLRQAAFTDGVLYKLICIDQFGKRYYQKFFQKQTSNSDTLDGSKSFPRHGITVTPK